MSAARAESVRRFLNPRSVAIAGISDSPGSLGALVLDNLERYAFSGDIHLINPRRKELRGRPCLESAAQLPHGVDSVVLAIPAEGVTQAVRECAARGVGGVVIFAAGFAEHGEAGKAMQTEIAEIARASGMVVEGPNCLGFINERAATALTFAVVAPAKVQGPSLAIVSQSGAMASALRAGLISRDLNVALALSTGNEAAHGVEDFIEYLLTEPDIGAIALVTERIRQPQRFAALAQRAAEKGVPIVCLHAGVSEGARRAALTHTGALAGDFATMRAVLKRRRIIFAESAEELVDLCDCLARWRHRPYGGAAIVCESGAFKALTLDGAERIGLPLPQPAGEAAAGLNALSPGFIVASNPVDLTAKGLSDNSIYGKAIDLLMADPKCGSLLVNIILTSEELARVKMPPVIEAVADWAQRRAVVFAMLGEDSPVPNDIISSVRAAGVPFFRSPERAMRALTRLTRWADDPLRAPPAPLAPAPRLPSGAIMEYEAKKILQSAGVAVPRGLIAHDAAGAVRAAAEIGFPVALKVQSADLLHKSDVGGVVLNLADAEAVKKGWSRLHADVGQAAPQARIDGVLVEAMSKPGVELIVGAKRDGDWGPVLAIGLGGVMAEAMNDVRFIAPDLSEEEIMHELCALRGARMLGAFRGRPPRDIAAAADVIAAVGRFMCAHPEVRELDINPLMVFEEGAGAVALDALMLCDE